MGPGGPPAPPPPHLSGNTYYPQYAAPYGGAHYGYGAVDLWPQLRPRLRELMGQFNQDPRVAEQACRSAQELVRGLHSPTELQQVVNELLYDMKRQHPQIRKLRFRCAKPRGRLVTVVVLLRGSCKLLFPFSFP